MNWPMVAISDVAEVVGGATPKSSVDEFWGGEIRWATPKDLSELGTKYIGDTPRTITERGLKSCAASVLPSNSVLFSSRAPIGHVAINTEPMATNQGFKSFVPGPDLDSSFLYWWLDANRARLQALGTGATFKEVSKAVVKRIEIPLPPLNEQKRIAGVLDQADALRRLRTRALDKLNTLDQAIFHEMFGDFSSSPSLPFAEVIHDIGNGVSPSRNGTLEDAVLTLSAITGQSFDSTKQKVDTFAAAVPANKRVESGDFLLCRGNGNPDLVGSGKLADESGQGVVYPDTIMRAKLNDARVDPLYVSALWRHPHIRKQIAAGAKTTNGTMKINQEVVKNISIPMPPLEKQIEFGLRSTALQRLQALHSEAAHGESALFASLQHRAFQGEL